ncbi:hypothetical protein RFI_24325 [Reticulomyxa filosa]|uniref:Uncharacterized protein n=1 Tax=Reticulomyxa filosa TaxID=46433 RepID=X6MJ03_RETFI|nr:hypothetical protein RFI_24325 [Reticulomyxa filosa]|eukprot:ETO13050.1 hypothetical protein RFI_24325 [Reticulomyxa filosa]
MIWHKVCVDILFVLSLLYKQTEAQPNQIKTNTKALLKDCQIKKKIVDFSDWYDLLSDNKQRYLAMQHVTELCKVSQSKGSEQGSQGTYARPKDIARQRWCKKLLQLLHDCALIEMENEYMRQSLRDQVNAFAINVIFVLFYYYYYYYYYFWFEVFIK